ncbi:nucleotidyltransferase family protein [Anaerococcus sp. WCA-380-WT-2B]|uniref:tRNA(Met) cytidine acetate ligase n=1 Tax=Anaerococcus porci TaxID=2652269 RepID=A0A6N7VSI0_9FIRM|nr:nucleotidyltransferase family protein [Anaerococcus porci]MSS77014.1 nucleotidyltransferase family protein [Anaerococcus porci]
MKKIGIISEFNPFHNGHEYILKEARKISQADILVSIMSGDFVQRGQASIIDKYKRANCAIKYSDLIVEMPTFISLQSANFFAYKNIELLNKINIDYLAFGIENIEESQFFDYANEIIDNEDKINFKIREFMDNGYSYTKASYLASNEIIDDTLFLTSNNILALEYIRAIKKINSNIKPIAIKRIGANNRDLSLGKDIFSSSTSIRNNIENENINTYLPKYSYEKILAFKDEYKNFPKDDYIYNIFRYKILVEKAPMNKCLCYENGIDNLLRKLAENNNNYKDFLEKAISQRFTKSRIRRLILNYCLDNFTELNNININFLKVLSFSEDSKVLLKNKNINFVIRKKDANSLNLDNKKIYDKMVDSSNLYSLIIGRELNYDFTRHIKITE